MKYFGNENNNLGKDGKYKCEDYGWIGNCVYYNGPRCKLVCNFAKDKQKDINSKLECTKNKTLVEKTN